MHRRTLKSSGVKTTEGVLPILATVQQVLGLVMSLVGHKWSEHTGLLRLSLHALLVLADTDRTTPFRQVCIPPEGTLEVLYVPGLFDYFSAAPMASLIQKTRLPADRVYYQG